MQNTNTVPGFFIVIEGMDGSGKSTVTKYLAQKYEQAGIPFVQTYEVGGTPIGKELRNLCFKKREDEQLDPVSRLLMAMAARLQHIKQVIKPATEAGKHVLCDRYTFSTDVFQGKLDGLESTIAELNSVHPLTVFKSKPDIVIYITVDAERAYNRGVARVNVDNDVYKNDIEKTKKIKQAYDEVMKKAVDEKQELLYIDGNQPLEAVHQRCDVLFNYIQKLFAERVKHYGTTNSHV